jgi:hypothetical protein
MIALGLFTTFLLGIFIAISISQKLKLIEVAGLAFLLGIGTQTFLMVCLDVLHIKITASTVIYASIAVMGCLTVYNIFNRKALREWLSYVLRFTFPKLTWISLVGLIAIIVVAVMNVAKTMYFPTWDTDSVRGFNLVGLAVAHEGTIRSLSLFVDDNFRDFMSRPGSYMSYVPLSQLSYAYAYMIGFETSKIMNALVFLSFIPVFYGVLSRFASHTLTVVVTFLMLLTPEMLAFSSLSGTNFTHAVYASLGICYFLTWYYKKIPSMLWLSAVLLMMNNWTRSEGLAFIAAACCLLLWHSIKEKSYKKLFLFSGLCIFPFLFWQIFLKIEHLESTNVFIYKPYWDYEKASYIVKEAWMLLKNSTYYGITFTLFFIVLLSNIWNIYKKRECVFTILAFVLSLVFYTILVYQVDYLWDTLDHIMHYSYKRFLFAFVPVAWFYIATNYNVKWLFDKVDKFIFRS